MSEESGMKVIKVEDVECQDALKAIVEDMMAADVGMQTMAATKRGHEKRLWNTINERYPESRDYVCRYKPDTGEIVFLYKAPKNGHVDD